MEKYQSQHDKIIAFIETLKGHKNHDGHDAHDIMKTIFTRGNCYKFAQALKIVFPEVVLYGAWKYNYYCNDPDHVIVRFDNMFYDITGVVDSNEWYKTEELTNEQEATCKTFCYSHKYGQAYGLRDKNGNHIDKIEEETELQYNTEYSTAVC